MKRLHGLNDAALRLLIAAVLGASFAVGHAHAAGNNSLLDISVDGRLIACANRDSGTVTIVDCTKHARLHEVIVGRHPEGLSFVGSTHQLAVAVYDDDKVVWLDADAGTILAEVEVFDEPYAVVSNRAGTRLYVTLDFPGQTIEFDARQPRLLRSMDSGPFSRGLALSADEQRLYISQFYSADVVAIDLSSGKIADRWPGVSNDNLSRQLVVHPTRGKVYLPHVRSRVTTAHGQGSIFPYVSVIDTSSGDGARRGRIPMDAFVGNLVTSNPWEAAISPDGRSVYVVFAGTNDMFACEVIDDDYRELAYRNRATLGANPRAVRVAPDGKTIYVYQALDFQITAHDAATLKELARIDVARNPLSPEVARGKTLFYSALQPMVGQRWISCASCHPDGQPDGRTWRNPEGFRNTQSLAGLSWTHPIHWSADRDEVQDFEHTIRGPLMQGQGLIRGSVNPELGEANRGRSADLDALAAYANSIGFTLSPFARGGLSEAAQRGKSIFFSDSTRCAACHGGPFYTDSQSGEAIQRHDVGTGEEPSEKLGPAYDTPTLLGVYRTAPYFHDGRAATLADVLVRHNPADKHGATKHLQPDQIADLVEFLKSLPYDDPVPEATAAHLHRPILELRRIGQLDIVLTLM